MARNPRKLGIERLKVQRLSTPVLQAGASPFEVIILRICKLLLQDVGKMVAVREEMLGDYFSHWRG